MLKVLWSSREPLMASDIPRINPSLSISTVQLALRNLSAKRAVEVADIGYSGTVLSRSYRPLISKSEYINNEILSAFENLDKELTARNIVSTLLVNEKNEAETIAELEELLEERKRELAQKNKKGE